MSSAAPKPSPKPGKVRVYRAIYKYIAQQSDELSFEEGDILYVSDSLDLNGWWQATCNGKTGLIPSNYVNELGEAIEYPLHEAAKRGNLEFLQECLKNRVSANGLDKSGSTAVYWAAHSSYNECLKVLLSIPNVSIDTQNKLGDTALHAAAWKGHLEACRMLLEKGANPSLKNNEGKLPVDLARSAEVSSFLRRFTVSNQYQAEANYVGDGEDSD